MRKGTLNGFFRKLGLRPWIAYATGQMKRNLIMSEGNAPFHEPLRRTGRSTFIAAKALFDHVTTGRPIFMVQDRKARGTAQHLAKRRISELEGKIRYLADVAELPVPVFVTRMSRSAIPVQDHVMP